MAIGGTFTYSASDALAFAKTMIKQMPVSDITVSYQIADYVNSMVWMAAPWRWTVGTITPFPLVAAQVDYTITTPNDFLYLIGAYLTDGSTQNWVECEGLLPTATNAGMVTKIAHVPGAPDVIRVHPKPPTSFTPSLVPLYKKVNTKITASNFATAGATGIPDQWFWVYQLGVLWLSYHYADDAQRAGIAVVAPGGKTQYSGFLGAFMDGLDLMRQSEKLIVSPASVTPKKERG